MIKSVPESVVFLLEKGKKEEARKVLAKIDPQLAKIKEIEFVNPEAKAAGSPVVNLFEEKRARSTIMFWISCFSAFVLIYSMNTWLPTLMMEAGYNLSSSLALTAVMQMGAIVGTIVFGPLVDKLGFKKVLVPLFFCGALALTLIGFTNSMFLVFALISVVGAASVGLQNLSNAFVSQYYPSTMRSTALGSTMAFGRIGGIVAPIFVGILITLNLMPQFNFAAIGSAAVLGGLAMALIQEKHANYHISVQEQEKKTVSRSNEEMTVGE